MMASLNWINRFLALLVSVAAMFIILFGWIIHKEHDLTKTAIPQQEQPQIAAPTATSYHPAPASTPIAVQHMYTQLHDHQAKSNLIQQVSTSQSISGFSYGYQWAESHAISNEDQCQNLPTESLDGCRNFVETNQYLSKTTNI
jgi:hypothetical protein